MQKATPRPALATASTDEEESRFSYITSIYQIRQLDPQAFERFVAYLFQCQGYTVTRTRFAGDEGIDLKLSKRLVTAVVQCKHTKGSVGQPVVRDLYGVLHHTGVGHAYVVTSGRFSGAAQQWAAGKPIHLIDGEQLCSWARVSSPKKRHRLSSLLMLKWHPIVLSIVSHYKSSGTSYHPISGWWKRLSGR